MQTYLILIFFTFSYILIDNGLQMIDAEIRYFMDRRRDEIERANLRKLKKD